MNNLCCNCNKLILQNNRSNAKFCSRQCFQQIRKHKYKELKLLQPPNATCAWCLTPIRKPNQNIKRSLKKHGKLILFCNRTCQNAARKLEGGISEIHPLHYGTGKINYRTLAFEAYEKRCVRCGYDENMLALDVHHKDHNHDNDNVSNLEILCSNCHQIEHRSRKRSVSQVGLEPTVPFESG